MKLQNLLFPEAGVCTEPLLYMRIGRRNTVNFLSNCKVLVFQKYAECSFDTYFNGLTVEKWLKYTNIGTVSLVLKLKGDFEITLMQHEKVNDMIVDKLINVRQCSLNQIDTIKITFDTLEPKGIFSFKLKALSAEAEYYGGWYDGDIDEKKLRDVYLAIDICTFKREAFIQKNLKLLNDKILNNPEHELYNHLQVFVSDNGQTLDIDNLSTDKIHIVKNKNLGGSGGFTRGLIEIMAYKEKYPATHALLMDDDVIIEIESLYRTYTFLCCLKDEYKDISVAGAMLRLDKQYIQHESGAVWNGDSISYVKRGLDLRKIDACLRNEIEEYVNYGAWWYYCMSLSVVNEQNLPLPIFIKADDIEYCLRNGKFLTLNGICVWHEPFENKYSSFHSYYWLRNRIYCNALHYPEFTKKRFLDKLYGEVLREVMYYRYKNADLLLKAVEDFYKGVEFLEQTDGEELHKEIMASGYKPVPPEQVDMPFSYAAYCKSLRERDKKGKRKWRLLTFNGLILPAKDNRLAPRVAPMDGCRPINSYRAKRVLQYDVISKKVFIVKRDRKEAIRILKKLFEVTLKTMAIYDTKMEEFKQNANRITNIVFWKKYLGIE